MYVCYLCIRWIHICIYIILLLLFSSESDVMNAGSYPRKAKGPQDRLPWVPLRCPRLPVGNGDVASQGQSWNTIENKMKQSLFGECAYLYIYTYMYNFHFYTSYIWYMYKAYTVNIRVHMQHAYYISHTYIVYT